MIKKIWMIVNIGLLSLALGLWTLVSLVKGYLGAVAWNVLMLVMGPLGGVLLGINLISLIICLFRKGSLKIPLLGLAMSLFIGLPMISLMGIKPLAYPARIEDACLTLTIHSPFKTDTLIGWGGDDIGENKPHAVWPSERWAYDIVLSPHDHDSKELEDFGIYGLPIYAPVEGQVVAVYDQEDDILPNTEDFLSFEGNYIYLEVKETGTYLLLNHLLKGSVDLKVGDLVQVGDYLGQVGNSGTTSEPHLHIHHQVEHPNDVVFPTLAQGLPLYFYDHEGQAYMPVRGQVLKGQD